MGTENSSKTLPCGVLFSFQLSSRVETPLRLHLHFVEKLEFRRSPPLFIAFGRNQFPVYYCTQNFSTVFSCFSLSQLSLYRGSSCLLPIDILSPSFSLFTHLVHSRILSLSSDLTFAHTCILFLFFFWCLLCSKRHFLVRFSPWES